MSETILTAQTVDGFALNEAFGCYVVSVRGVPCNVTPGQEYTVVWDSVEYVRKAVTFTSADGFAGVYIGNTLVEGKANSGEPFAIVYDIDNSYLHYMALDASASHTVAVYTVTTEIGVIVKDRTGKDVEHKGAVGVRVRTLDGSTKDFIDGDSVPAPVTKEVQLDFSAGGMTILPNEGEVFSEVSIPKPTALVPQNIAEGVNVAGIVGSLVGGGNVKIASGKVMTSDGAAKTITHNLGVIPDLIIFMVQYTANITTTGPFCLMGFSSAMSGKVPNLSASISRRSSSDPISASITSNSYFGETYSGTVFIHNVTTTTFKVPAHVKGQHYQWVAISGLV